GTWLAAIQKRGPVGSGISGSFFQQHSDTKPKHPFSCMKPPASLPSQLLTFALIANLCLSPTLAPASAFGPDPGHTGAPGEPTGTACHTPTVARGGAILVSGVPPAYNPGVTYPLTVTMSGPVSKFGFQLTAVTGAGAQAGTFVNTTTNTQILSTNMLGNSRF